MSFGPDSLKIDCEREAVRIGEVLKRTLRETRRKGIVLGLSGGIDSSVTAALAVRALGAERVFGVFMPEADSDPESLALGRELAAHLGLRAELEDIAPALAALRCYERRNDAVARVIPDFTPEWKFKLVLPGPGHQGLNFFSVVARSPDGREVRERLPLDAYLAIVAATNFKQRIRKSVEYHWADRLHFLVAGTPNVLLVNNELPARTLAELLALARAKPGSLNFGSTSQGGSPHMSGELLKLMARVDLVHVPYKGGGPAMTDLMGGQVDLSFATVGSVLSHLKSGKLTALAVASKQRSALLPDVPTFEEAGVKGFVIDTWYGLLAPAGTPADAIGALTRAASDFARSASVRERLANAGLEPQGVCGEPFAAQIGREIDANTRIARELNLKAE